MLDLRYFEISAYLALILFRYKCSYHHCSMYTAYFVRSLCKNICKSDQLRLQLYGAIYRPDSFVMMLRYCGNLKAIRYESTSVNRIAADK